MQTNKAPGTNRERLKSLNHALEVLNDAAEDSSVEIRKMVNTDYRKLKKVLAEVKPEVEEVLSEFKAIATDSLAQTKETLVATTKHIAKNVDESVHLSPWVYLGGAAATSIVIGFLLGRKSKN